MDLQDIGDCGRCALLRSCLPVLSFGLEGADMLPSSWGCMRLTGSLLHSKTPFLSFPCCTLRMVDAQDRVSGIIVSGHWAEYEASWLDLLAGHFPVLSLEPE